MTAAGHQPGNAHGHERFQGVSGLVIGAVMVVGRGALSRLVADLAGVRPGDRVLDVGCGPGAAPGAWPPTGAPRRRRPKQRPRRRRPASPAPGTTPTGPAGACSPGSARTAPPASLDEGRRYRPVRLTLRRLALLWATAG